MSDNCDITIDTKKHYKSIELLRVVAALAVCGYHMPLPYFKFGYVGVDLFFSISGFVMMLSTEKSTDQFLTKRFIRIAPIYYLFTIFIFSTAFVFPCFGSESTKDLWLLLKSLAFVPFNERGRDYPIVANGWTLNYEAFFYLIFFISTLFTKHHRGIVTSAILCTLYVALQPVQSLPLAAYKSQLIWEFALGISCYFAAVKKNLTQSLFVLVLCGLSLAYAGELTGRLVTIGLPCAAFLLLCVNTIEHMKLPKITGFLGGLSYALYLAHPYVIKLVDKSIVGFAENALLAGTLSLTFSLCIAALIYKFIEAPMTRFLRYQFVDETVTHRPSTIHKG